MSYFSHFSCQNFITFPTNLPMAKRQKPQMREFVQWDKQALFVFYKRSQVSGWESESGADLSSCGRSYSQLAFATCQLQKNLVVWKAFWANILDGFGCMIDQSSFTPDRLTNTEMYTETRTMRLDTETQIQINAQRSTYRQTDTQKRRTAVSLQNIKKIFRRPFQTAEYTRWGKIGTHKHSPSSPAVSLSCSSAEYKRDTNTL